MTMIIGPGSHEAGPAPSGLNRVLAAVRLQVLAWPSSIALSWSVLAMSFAVNLILWNAMSETQQDDAWTGGLSSIYLVVFSVYITAMTQIFPLAVGFGLTRRAFYAGMATLATAQAVIYAVVFELLGVVEAATDGWGAELAFFRPEPLGELTPIGRIGAYAVPFLILIHIGICLGTTHRRWGTNGIYVLLAAVVAAIGLIVAVITLGGWWIAVDRWFDDQSLVALTVLWPLPLLAGLVAAGMAGIRRAAP